jgi:hypothetical protein
MNQQKKLPSFATRLGIGNKNNYIPRDKVLLIIEYMGQLGITVPEFLHFLFWGDENCTSDKTLMHVRKNTLSSPLMPDMLLRWWRPPTGTAGSGFQLLYPLVVQWMSETIDYEMEAIEKKMRPPPPVVLGIESLASL